MRFLTKEEWFMPPSLKDNISLDKFNETLNSGFIFIKKFCERKMELKKKKGYESKMTFDIQVFAISMHFFHYYSYYLSFRKFDRFQLATACVFLAGKLCNDFFNIEKMMEIFNHIKSQSNSSTSSKPEDNFDMMKFEIELMTIVGFDLEFELPYNYIEPCVNQIIKDKEKRRTYINLTFSLVHDSYRRALCLLFFPKYIALAAIYTACVLLNDDKAFDINEVLELDKEIDKETLLFCISEFDLAIDKTALINQTPDNN